MSEKHRAEPGSSGEGDFYHIVVRPKSLFTTFRSQDVGAVGGLERVAGQRPNGHWATQAWLIQKKDAHVTNGQLVADNEAAQNLLDSLGSKPVHKKGDIFTAKDRPNIPEKDKPTLAQRRAWEGNKKKG